MINPRWPVGRWLAPKKACDDLDIKTDAVQDQVVKINNDQDQAARAVKINCASRADVA
jgi:hypothetical protein